MTNQGELRPTATYPAIVGKVIARHRSALGLNQSQIAQALHMNQSAWSKIERGAVSPTVEQLSHIAEILGISPGGLLSEADRVVEQLRARGLEVVPWRAEPERALNKGLVLIGAIALGGLVAAALSSGSGNEEDDQD